MQAILFVYQECLILSHQMCFETRLYILLLDEFENSKGEEGTTTIADLEGPLALSMPLAKVCR